MEYIDCALSIFSAHPIKIYDYCNAYILCSNLSAYFMFRCSVFVSAFSAFFVFVEPVGKHTVGKHSSNIRSCIWVIVSHSFILISSVCVKNSVHYLTIMAFLLPVFSKSFRYLVILEHNL
jgi:hypothetical protein